METKQLLLLSQIRESVDAAHSILITGQANPDGDSIGSQLALYDILTQHVQQVTAAPVEIVIANDELPAAQYDFLPQIGSVTPFEAIQDRQFDVGFILDGSRDRIGRVLPVLEKCRYAINIDHHRNRAPSAEQVAWIEPEMSSVAEMVYGFLEHPAWQAALNPDIAACLYAGLIYDTGSFRYPSTTARTLEIAGKLIATGIDFARIAECLFLEKSFAAVQLLSAVLRNLQRTADGAIIWGTITQALLAAVQATPNEEEGIITQYAFLKGGKVAVLFRELDQEKIKVSFRAHGALDVGRFAQKISAQGGGHPRAAGCTLSGTMHAVQETVIRALTAELGNLAKTS